MEKTDTKNKMATRFKWIGVATWILTIDGLKIACDPVLCPKGTVQRHGFGVTSKRIVAPIFAAEDFKDIDLWLITHDHEDHLDVRGLEAINPDATIICNAKATKKLKQIYPQRLQVLKWHQTTSFQGKGLSVEIEAMPTVHASNFLAAAYLGSGNGYWLTIRKNDNRLSVYVTGDTVPHRTVLMALKGRKTDILIPNMGAVHQGRFGGPLTLSAASLKLLIGTINPEIILPVHFGTFSHFAEPIAELARENDPRIRILQEGDCCTLDCRYIGKQRK